MQQQNILYSFRRCPYAIRARMTLRVAGIEYEHREVLLRDKPAELVRVSAKATVPVLITDRVIDESIDIMRWALAAHDPECWLADNPDTQRDIEAWVTTFETTFKPNLDAYKYGNDKTAASADQKNHARQNCETILRKLDARLNANTAQPNKQLFGEHLGFADVAVFPFVRQYAAVDRERFREMQLSALTAWLDRWLESSTFLRIMDKHPLWAGTASN